MSVWDTYPANYRAAEVQQILSAARAGECVSVVGLSGAGKSNLFGFLAHRQSSPDLQFVLADCNQLTEHSPAAFFRLARRMLGDETVGGDEFRALDKAIERRLAIGSLCLLLDLSLLLDRSGRIFGDADRAFFNNLRALRDAHKYRLTYAAATRHALPPASELAELFLAHTLWLGPLAESDAQWTVMQFAIREGLKWGEPEARALTLASGGYAAFLRATCEARAAGAELESIATHPALRARVEEFLSDQPTAEELRRSGLDRHPFLRAPGLAVLDTTTLTAKENLLLAYFRAHANAVCAKDDLIRAVWPEDKVFERGVRDDSLAQLVRRLREKIESDPANPRHILTIPGRGYRFVAD